jgi:hypothetical protein
MQDKCLLGDESPLVHQHEDQGASEPQPATTLAATISAESIDYHREERHTRYLVHLHGQRSIPTTTITKVQLPPY